MGNYTYKCTICGGDIDKELSDMTATKIGRRYAHNSCLEHQDEIKQELEKIHSYCRNHINDYNEKTVSQQIGKYMKDYTPEEILKILKYFYEVKRGSRDKANGGIGIVPYVAEEAIKYWQNKENIKKLLEMPQPEVVEMSDKYRRPQVPRGKMVKPRNRRWIDLD